MKRKTPSKTTALPAPLYDQFASLAEQWSEQWQAEPGRFVRFNRDAMARMNSTLMDDAMELTHAVVELGSARLAEDMDCASKIMNCRSQEELAKVQEEWFRTAFRNYRDGGAAIFGKYMHFVSDSLQAAAENTHAVFAGESGKTD